MLRYLDVIVRGHASHANHVTFLVPLVEPHRAPALHNAITQVVTILISSGNDHTRHATACFLDIGLILRNFVAHGRVDEVVRSLLIFLILLIEAFIELPDQIFVIFCPFDGGRWLDLRGLMTGRFFELLRAGCSLELRLVSHELVALRLLAVQVIEGSVRARTMRHHGDS